MSLEQLSAESFQLGSSPVVKPFGDVVGDGREQPDLTTQHGSYRSIGPVDRIGDLSLSNVE
jgi:hypothetical protein